MIHYNNDTFLDQFINNITICHDTNKLLWSGSSQIMKIIDKKSIGIRDNNVYYNLRMSDIIYNDVYKESHLPNNNIVISFTTNQTNAVVKYQVHIYGQCGEPVPNDFYVCQYESISLPLVKLDEYVNYYKLIFETNYLIKSLFFYGNNPINLSVIIINNKTINLDIDQYDRWMHESYGKNLIVALNDFSFKNIPQRSSYKNEIIVRLIKNDDSKHIYFMIVTMKRIN